MVGMPVKRPARSPRDRLLAAGKALFARVGYEQASTAAIAKLAKTSESQLVRHFGGKAGLLEAIYDEGWQPLNATILQLVAGAPDSRRAIVGTLATVLTAFQRDPAIASVFLFEGRRLRNEKHRVTFSRGYREFAQFLRRLVRRAQEDGTIPPDLNDAALAAALIGAAEGMIRDFLAAKPADETPPFPERAIRDVFAALVDGLGAQVMEKPVRPGQGG